MKRDWQLKNDLPLPATPDFESDTTVTFTMSLTTFSNKPASDFPPTPAKDTFEFKLNSVVRRELL